MKVEYLKSFSKDLDNLQNKNIKSRLIRVLESLEETETIENIANIKKLKGHKSAYRIRLADYRLGFFVEANIIKIARFVHRKDIYRSFP